MLLIMRRKSKRRIVVFWLLGTAAFFMVFVSFYSLRVFAKKNVFVSPIPKQNSELQTEHMNTVIALLREKQIAFSGVFVFDSTSYMVKLESGEEVFLASAKPLTEQVSSLQLILSRLTIEGKRVSRVDFRFDTPVLTMR